VTPALVVLFDLDGTLVDSGVVVERHWRRWAARHDLDPATFLHVVHGRRSSEVVREIAPHLDANAEAAALDGAEEHDTDGLRVVPGAAAILATLAPGSWAVVTSGHRSLATRRLGAVGLPVPPVMVCGDEVSRGKPHPEPFLRAAELLGVDPARCVVVEDAPAGIASGRAAGMRVVGITTNHPAADLAGADVLVADLTGLVAVLSDLDSR
jgi:sugar-phosphatase